MTRVMGIKTFQMSTSIQLNMIIINEKKKSTKCLL